MGITFNLPATSVSTPAPSETGSTFMGTIARTEGVFVVVHGRRIVNLRNPSQTWDCAYGAVSVYDYRPVDLEITVKPK